ncbi:MAG: type I 3-dehydroquinate dehydratase [Lachnospiraceae bacterium]|jgi:3-dehydroquinate dehydratase type I
MSRIIKVRNISIGKGRPKICALVIGETAEEILNLVDMSNDAACDMIELRADHFEEVLEPDRVKSLLRKIKRAAKKPVIFTFRSKDEGGQTDAAKEYYRQLIMMVAKEKLADIVDVEASSLEGDSTFVELLKDEGAIIIISKHDFIKTPSEDEIIKDYLEMERLGADIIKVAYMPNSKKDVLALMNATEEVTSNLSSCPVIAISMGHLGMITRIMGEFLESAITFAAITRASAPGQINVQGMKSILDLIHNNYKKVILVGFMGAGKTAVASALAADYGLKKIDLNSYIEMKEQAAVADIRSTSEELFRDKESKYLRQVLKKNYQVLSAGYGVVLRQENIDLMKENGIIIFLKADVETISERLKNDKTRSLLADNIDLDYIRELINSNTKLYESVADVIIDTKNKNVEQISKEIVETLGFTL